MSYQTYITEALVCGSRDHNTSDKSYLLFTREAGMLYALAKSVRLEKSKQRFSLQEFSHTRLSLIRGKAGWRIAGTEPIHNLYTTAETREARVLLRNTLRLLRRTLQGEVPHIELFDDVLAGLNVCNAYDTTALEQVLSLRMLYMLGYVAPDPRYQIVLDAPSIEACMSVLTDDQKRVCVDIIADALAHSQL